MAHKSLILDRYRVIEVAGAGGYATVYHAYDTHLKRDVAIKSMELSAADIERAQALANKARLRQEQARQAAAAAHAATAAAAGHVMPPAETDGLTPGSKISFAEWAGGSSQQAAAAAGFPDEPAFLDALDASRQQKNPRLHKRHLGGTNKTAALTAPVPTASAPDNNLPFIPTPDQIAAALGQDGIQTEGFPADASAPDAVAMAPADAAAATGLPGVAAAAPHVSLSDMTAPDPGHMTTAFALAPSTAMPAGALGTAGAFATPTPKRKNAALLDAPQGSLTQAFASAAATDLTGTDPFAHIPGLNEARTIAQLNDANIVTVYDCELHGRTIYIIMEYIEGKTLANIMNEVADDIDLDIIAAVFTSVAHALEVAHDAGVLHLDVKPENVVVNSKGIVKVTDFGLATLIDASGKGTAGGGTIGYMPLEQMRQEALDGRTDEWALASLTYEMLSGVNPFFADDLASAERVIEEAELVVPSMCWDILDPAADDVIFAALDGDVSERYDTVAEFAEELAPYLGNVQKGTRELAAVVKPPEAARPAAGAAGAVAAGIAQPYGQAAGAARPARPAKPKRPKKPHVPLVERMAGGGAVWLARIISLLSCLMVGAVSLVNMRFDPSAVYGLFSSAMPVFWILLAAIGAVGAVWPPIGALVALAAFVVMLFFNGAYLLGGVVAVVVAAWWWLFGRRSYETALSLMLQPLCGAFGLGAVAPVTAGMLLSVVEAAATALTAAVVAFAFASLGSGDLMNWAVTMNAVTAANPLISSASMSTAALEMLMSPTTWCVSGSWVVAAAAYALCCVRGTQTFDVLGAVVAAGVLLAGVLGGSFAAGGAFDPLALVCALVPGVAGIVCAAIGVPDKARTED